jgi:hypothetical protein
MNGISPDSARQAIRELEDMMYDIDSVYRRSAIGLAIAALERCIPEAIVQDENQFFTGKCPECGHLLGRGTDYCTKCAQAISWPEGKT